MRRISLMTATAALLLAGCTSGSDTGSDDAAPSPGGVTASQPSAQPSSEVPPGPTCDDIWVAGQTLPDDYDTCTVDGDVGSQDVVPCDDGSKLVTFNDAFYAVTGGEIREPAEAPLQDTDSYGDAYSACTDAE